MRYLAVAKNGNIVAQVSIRLLVASGAFGAFAMYRTMKKIEQRKAEKNSF